MRNTDLIKTSPVIQPQKAKKETGCRPWAYIIGAALIPVNAIWLARSEVLDTSGFPTCMSLFYNVVFCIIVLLALNAVLKRFLPRIALNRKEFIIIYAMLVTGSSLAGLDYIVNLVAQIPHVAAFATPENRWAQLVLPHLPSWLTIDSFAEAVQKYENGHSALTWEYAKIWLVPVGCWSIFILAIAACGLSINLILRKHWVEDERLSYPIVQIPLLITEDDPKKSIFTNKLFWIGFGIAAFIDVLNGLNQFFPALPYLDVKQHDLTPLFQGYPPWDAMGYTRISFYPFVIGLGFFMPTNMAFSCWFFFIFRKLMIVAAQALGMRTGSPPFPYTDQQSYGAWIALVISMLWFSRDYLKEVWRMAMTRGGNDGGVSYRSMLLVLLVGFLVSVFFLVIAGLTPIIAVLYVLLYLIFVASITRVRAEVGPPTHEMAGVSTTGTLVMGFGSSNLGAQNLSVFSMLFFQNILYRGLLMPQQAECLKAASETKIKMRTMAFALVLAAVIGVYIAFWAHLDIAYTRQYKASWNPAAPGTAWANSNMSQTVTWITNPTKTNFGALGGIAFGAIIAMILARLSVAIYGFPFHPAGYAIGMAFGLDYIWFPIIISWLAKVIILRYSGLRGYRRAIPFFVGLVLGEFVVGGMWNFVRGVLKVPTYSFYM